MVTTYLPEERRSRIATILSEEGKVTAQDLSRRLGVSADTIRRDLIQLERTNQLNRTHGGALPRSPATAAYHLRKEQNSTAKMQIAKKTVALLQEGQVIFMDSGTTVEEVARHLSSDFTATVVTHSLPVAMTLGSHRHLRVIMPGGTVDGESMILNGSGVMDQFRNIRADVCLLGACSIDADTGITCTRFEEVDIKRQIIRNSRMVIVPATSDKFGTAAPFFIAPMECVSVIVTEQSTPDERLLPCRNLSIRIEKGES
ncbi:MAG: DeoR/GlpR transcriptional regulator [Deltaproteobacteria bacterium]|nr:DeoR/GlpR transcriptional regulator [Deltaproteobacteria bacterium]